VEVDLDTDHFTDPTKPGITYKHIKPISISIGLPRSNLNKKRPIAEDWFIKPLAKSWVSSISPTPRSMLV
jgi:hypothetical protein